ncbi:hypothetical protein [Flavihumibacter sp. CACIAM 22H1]|uniref:hypothetical protein n=1 Tax=Flavihumibacter sp. CACIAM 22H1 TaxID=1812911 RepID=UPI000AB91DE7|nr:hypothetical protein [Flavihumibacter sp. CACIAM 22H1]
MRKGSIFLTIRSRKYPALRFLSNLMRCCWLFFPSLVFIMLAMLVFSQLSQGRDILISFTETAGSFGHVLFAKLIFLIAIFFWVYVSWYSSRMVGYIKEYQHREAVRIIDPVLSDEKYESLYAMELRFLERFPRIIGYSCLLVVMVVISLLLYPDSWINQQPFLLLIGLAVLVWLTDRWLIRKTARPGISATLRNIAWVLFALVILLTILFVKLELFRQFPYILLLLFLLLVLYMLYINVRRQHMNRLEKEAQRSTRIHPVKPWEKLVEAGMNYLRLPREEKNYFAIFNLVGIIGLFFYLLAINSLSASVQMGPFAVVLLAFAVLLGFGNLLSALSCKYQLNVHFIIFLLAAFLPTPDHHIVRTASLSERTIDPTIYAKRQHLSEYFYHWLKNRPEIDNMATYDLNLVLANGGASRSAYWVATVLGKLEDASLTDPRGRFSRHLFCLSGTSGGALGISNFYATLLHQQEKQAVRGFEESGRNFLRQDFLSFTLARMMGPDFFNYIPLLNKIVPNEDRAEALELAIERATDDSYYRVGFDSTWFDQCLTQSGKSHNLPILFINTTRVKDGSPGIVSNIHISPNIFNRRVDVAGLLSTDQTMRLSTAAILGARFPYISPAGRINQPKKPSPENGADTIRAHYFVDGGYFDNSGAGAVQEMIRTLLMLAGNSKDPLIRQRAAKLKIRVLHITNSPQGTVPLKPIGPFVNDVLSPLLTITGAFDMQTTVNDQRFITYMNDLKSLPGSGPFHSFDYIPLHLYNDPAIPADTLSKGPYVMNWFISDSVRNQMDRRLLKQPRLDLLIKEYSAQNR